MNERILKFVFWLTFGITFLTSPIIQEELLGLSDIFIKRVFWVADFIILFMIFLLFINKKYQNDVIMFFGFLAGFIIISTLFNNSSMALTILAFRSNYIFIPLLFILYVYDFSEEFYLYFFKLFLKLAILNSLLSLLSFLYYGTLYTGDVNGGIFGGSGTGIGIMFVVPQAILFFLLYLYTHKERYLLFSLVTSFFLITGKAFFGFPLLISSLLLVTFLISQRLQNKFFQRIIISLFVLTTVITFAMFFLPRQLVADYVGRFTRIDEFMAYDEYAGTAGGKLGFGRVGSLAFGISTMLSSPESFILGKGIGSISYTGSSVDVGSKTHQAWGLKDVLFSLAIPYEFGFMGVLFVVFFSWLLFIRWLKVRRRFLISGLDYFYLINLPIVLYIFFLSLFYTSAFKNYTLMFFLGVQLGYFNKIFKRRNNKISN